MSSEEQRIEKIITDFNGMCDASHITKARLKQTLQRLAMGTIRTKHAELRNAAIDAAARLGESESLDLRRLLTQIDYQKKIWGTEEHVIFATVNGHSCVSIFKRKT